MFDLLGDEVKVPINLDLLETEVDYKERMFWERDLMGTALSDNPINKKIESYSNTHAVFFGQINSKKSYEQLKTIGQVLSITKRTTRAKEQFIICELGLLDNSMELVVWPDKMEASQYLWETGTYLELDVKTNLRNGSVNMIFEKGKKFEFENQDLEEFVSKNENIIINNQTLEEVTTPSVQSDYDEVDGTEEKEEAGIPFNRPIEIKENPQQINRQFKIEFVGSKNLIEDNFGYIRVKGEIGRVSKPASGHIYFDLNGLYFIFLFDWSSNIRNLDSHSTRFNIWFLGYIAFSFRYSNIGNISYKDARF